MNTNAKIGIAVAAAVVTVPHLKAILHGRPIAHDVFYHLRR
jgi:hypothetical protein